MGKYSIGVDVGGTNTDIVLFDGSTVIKTLKVTTSEGVSDAVIAGIQEVLAFTPKVSPEEIGFVQLGTTHMMNALKQKKGLSPVAILRLGAPSTTLLPPLCDWKDVDLKAQVGAYVAVVRGGYNYNGEPIARLDKAELTRHIEAIKAEGITHIAVSGVYKDVKPDQELAVKALIETLYPEAKVFLSLPYPGPLLQKENATVISAALDEAFRAVIRQLSDQLKEMGLVNSRLLISENGGAVSPVDQANAVSTLRAATRNSVAGAIQLCAKAPMSGVVINVDIGGTTADAVFSENLAGTEVVMAQYHHVEEAGVSFSFPTVRGSSMCLGGGTSIVTDADGAYRLGHSVAKALTSEARCCGGDTLTITDIAVANGRLDFEGVKLKAFPDVDLEAVDAFIHTKLADFICEVGSKIQRPAEGLRLVGGGACLFDLNKLKAILQENQPSIQAIVCPEGADVANAIGAGLALLSATHTAVIELDACSLELAETKIADKAKQALLCKGADEKKITVKPASSTPMLYLPGRPYRVSVTCEGPKGTGASLEVVPDTVDDEATRVQALLSDSRIFAAEKGVIALSPKAEETALAPAVSISADKIHTLTAAEIKHRTLGFDYLGSGGGGSATFGALMVLARYESGSTVSEVPLEALPDDAKLFCFGIMGSPDVLGYNPPSLDSMVASARQLEQALGHKFTAIIPFEAGGANGLLPSVLAAELGLPVVRCDAMGRAFPGINMVTPVMFDAIKAHVGVVASANGCEVVRAESANALEDAARELTGVLGGAVSLSYLPMTGATAKRVCVADTPTIAAAIGEAVLRAQAAHSSPVPYINERLQPYKGSDSSYGDLTEVLSGKVTRLFNFDEGAFRIGGLVIQSEKSAYEVIFQNENLVLRQRLPDATSKVLTQTPDLVILVDAETYSPFGSQDYSDLIGQNVCVLTMDAPPLLKTEAALQVVGPNSPTYKLDEVLTELDKRAKTAEGMSAVGFMAAPRPAKKGGDCPDARPVIPHRFKASL